MRFLPLQFQICKYYRITVIVLKSLLTAYSSRAPFPTHGIQSNSAISHAWDRQAALSVFLCIEVDMLLCGFMVVRRHVGFAVVR